MRATFDTGKEEVVSVNLDLSRNEEKRAYTWTLRKSSAAEGACGMVKTLAAIKQATVKPTVVKKPKACCTRLTAEFMMADYGSTHLSRASIQDLERMKPKLAEL